MDAWACNRKAEAGPEWGKKEPVGRKQVCGGWERGMIHMHEDATGKSITLYADLKT